MDSVDLKKTSLYECHVSLYAKMVPFYGWEMPLQYKGIIEEHNTVRETAGLFDVSHMGRFWLKGKNALNTIQKLITNDVEKLEENQAMYTPVCNPKGGVLDDIIIYKFDQQKFLLVVNASNTKKDLLWINKHALMGTDIFDYTEKTAQLAVQGPLSAQVLQELTKDNIENLRLFQFIKTSINGIDAIVSKTGYTGDAGFEIYISQDNATKVWNDILSAGSKMNIQPVGLGARDSLRLEACLPLYGQELSEEITPLEAGLNKFVKLTKQDFIGKEALAKQHKQGVQRKLAGFEMLDRGIPRSGYTIYSGEGANIGFVTSGNYSPTVKKYLGLGLIRVDEADAGDYIYVQIRGKYIKAIIVQTPFYKKN